MSLRRSGWFSGLLSIIRLPRRPYSPDPGNFSAGGRRLLGAARRRIPADVRTVLRKTGKERHGIQHCHSRQKSVVAQPASAGHNRVRAVKSGGTLGQSGRISPVGPPWELISWLGTYRWGLRTGPAGLMVNSIYAG